MRLVKEFGFYPYSLHIKAGPVTISPLPDLKRIASDVLASDGIEKNWIYAPPEQVHHFMKGEVRTRECPYTTRVFGLPKTHLIEHAAATSEDHLDFHLWALSFFVGMRLTATEAGFLDATPVTPGRLVDFFLLPSSLVRTVELAEHFWKTNRDKPRCAKRFAAAVHALFLSQNPQSLQFEQFVQLYMAIDACYALTVALHRPQKHPKHADRIAWMCSQFRFEPPAWADPTAPGGSEVAAIRNDTLSPTGYTRWPSAGGGRTRRTPTTSSSRPGRRSRRKPPGSRPASHNRPASDSSPEKHRDGRPRVLSRRRVNRLPALRCGRRLEQSTVPKTVSTTVFKLRRRFLG